MTRGSATIRKFRNMNATTIFSSAEELAPWGNRIREVSEQTRQTFVITNNHYLGKAVVNALELISMLKATKVQVPEPLRLRYPELEGIASNPPESPTLSRCKDDAWHPPPPGVSRKCVF